MKISNIQQIEIGDRLFYSEGVLHGEVIQVLKRHVHVRTPDGRIVKNRTIKQAIDMKTNKLIFEDHADKIVIRTERATLEQREISLREAVQRLISWAEKRYSPQILPVLLSGQTMSTPFSTYKLKQ